MRFNSAIVALRPAMHVRILTSAALALAVVAGTHTEVRAADEQPDLKIELVGLPLSNGAREVQVRVSNVSAWWATGSRLSVQTVSPTAGSGNVKEMDVGNLDPGQSVTLTYTLAGACNGDVVKANVAGAKNYAGVAESKLNDNQVQSEVCKAQPPANEPAPNAGVQVPRSTTATDVDTRGAGLQIPRSTTASAVDPRRSGLQIPRSTTANEVDATAIDRAIDTSAPPVASGAGGITGYEVVSSYGTPGGGPVTAQCPDGKKVLGGGAGSTRYLEFSYPTNNNTAWIVGIIDNPPGGSATAFAICANVS